MKIDFKLMAAIDEFLSENCENETVNQYLKDESMNMIYNFHHLQKNQQISFDYLGQLYNFFIDNENKRFNISDLTDHHDKFIKHVKHYIDNRHRISDYVDVSFNNEYTKIKIHERYN